MTTACQNAAHQADSGKPYPPRMCLKATREAFGVPSHDFTPDNGRDPLAREAWQFAKHKHRVGTSAVDRAAIPANVPVFFSKPGDPDGAWHVMVGCGGNKGRSTDIKRIGRLDLTTIETIEREWGMVLLGYTEDLNTVRVYTPPAPTPKPKSRGALIDDAIGKLVKSRKANATLSSPRAKLKVRQIDAALADLRKIPAV